MRGIGETKTVIMLDDSILNDSFHQNVFWNIIPIDAIERVEVIPGPFSALYGGRGGIGGTVKFITKMPEKEEFSVKGVYGSNRMMRGNASYGNKLHDKLSLYICYDYMQTDGYVADYITKSAEDGSGDIPVTGWEKTTDSKGNPRYLIGDRGKNESWEWSVLSKLKFDFSDTSRLTFTFSPSQWNYGSSSAGLDDPDSYLTDASTGAPVSSGNITFDDDGGQKNIDLGTATFLGGKTERSKRYRYNLAYETEFTPDINLKATVEYVDENKRGLGASPLEGATSSGGPGKVCAFPFDRWQGRIESKAFDIFGFNNLTVGADYMTEEGGRENYIEMTDWRDMSTKGEMSAKSWGISSVYSFFVQDEMILMKDRLTLYLGGRLDSWKISDLMDWNKNEDIGANKYKDRDETYFSPKGSVKYSPSESTTLRLSLAKAFTAPRLHDMLGGASKTNYMLLASPYLKPEKATCWEAGVDQTILNKTLVRATYFENYLRDYKYREYWDEAGIRYGVSKSGGKARIRGIELGIKHQITSFINAYANMTYQDTEVTEDKQVPEKEGKRMTNVPQEMYNFGLLCENYAGFRGSVTGRYVGKVYGDSLNRDRKNHVYGSYDPYFTLDTKVGYEIRKGLEVSFAVDNLLDKDYYQGWRAPGREFFGEVVYRF
jgi:iron complex outermembrane receptor protein